MKTNDLRGVSMLNVLFVCVHNSARSQIAETLLNDLGKGLFKAESAGIEAGRLNPFVVKVLSEKGYDISNKKTHSVFDFFKEGRTYQAVVKVCDQSNAQRCPIFPRTLINEQWDFPDPSTFLGSEAEILQRVRGVYDRMYEKILEFIEQYTEFANRRKTE